MKLAQSADQSVPLKPWLYQPGQSGCPGGSKYRTRKAVNARAIDLAAEFGGWSRLNEGDRQLLTKAAELSLRSTIRLDNESATRIGNAIDRILRHLRRRHPKRRRQQDTAASVDKLRELLK